MSDKDKPEWFEIAENDRPSVPTKPSKTLPLAAVLAAGLIIGIGAVVAQTQEEPPANATETTSVSSNSVTSTDQGTNGGDTTSTAAPAAPNSPAAPSSPAVPSSPKETIVNPNITKLPTGGGDDHEGGEHHGIRPPHHEDGEEGHEGHEGDDD